DQHLLSGKVQVIGRLVEYQKVRRVVEHPRDREPRFLPAGERPDRFVDVVSRELERAGERTKRADAILREVVLKLLEDGEVRIEHVEGLLREVSHAQAGAQP